MSLFFQKDHEKLDKKISELSEEFKSLKYLIYRPHEESSWENIMVLMKEIQVAFKTIRYPTKRARDEAWQQFFELRQDIFDKKNKRFNDISKEHKDELSNMLGGLEYWAFRERIRQMLFTELSEIKAEVIENGQKLNEASKYFSSVKYQMTSDDKIEIFEKIKEIRESHDGFWNEYKDRSQQLLEAKEERKKDYEERRERRDRAKNSLVENVENNKEKLAKAENALAIQVSRKDHLESQLEGDCSKSYRTKCEERLDECNDKIEDIENYIDKLKRWVEEGEDKLRNWQ